MACPRTPNLCPAPVPSAFTRRRPAGSGDRPAARSVAGSAAPFRRHIAQKEAGNEPLTAQDYADIFHVGRAAEHNFLVFYSLLADDEALSTPYPVMKIADGAGGGPEGWLEAAVGAPLEWDQIVPSFGRHEIVKGAAYSYREFISESPLTGKNWRTRAATAKRPAWMERFMPDKELSCPPKQQ